MGMLRVNGTIDLNQFWPTGSGDADTTKIKLQVQDGSFEYKKDGSQKYSTTRAFVDAVSKGQITTPVIETNSKSGIKTITARLQGVDAPELHYKAAPLRTSSAITDTVRKAFNALNKERRQAFAQSATVALAKHLKKFADKQGVVKATFQTQVDAPYDAIDTYGRFIGNIILGSGLASGLGSGHDINIWLVENGWALPAFYTSMTETEIRDYLTAWDKGKKKTRRPSRKISLDAGDFDWRMLYNKPPHKDPFKLGDDTGKVLMPKLFRRQVAWKVSTKSGAVPESAIFQSYLRKKPDQLVLLKDFLDNGVHSATVRNLHEFVDSDNKVQQKAEALVFREKPGTLVNAKGKKVTKW